MKRMLMKLCFGMTVILMSSCASQVASLANPDVTTPYFEEQPGERIVDETAGKGLSYTAFLKMLELNGFAFKEIGKTNAVDCFLAVGSRHLDIGVGQITIYEFDSPTPFIRGFFGTRGTVASIKQYDDAFLSVQIDYVFEYLTFEEGVFIEANTQVQKEFFIGQNTLLLMDSELKVGMEVTVFEFLAEPGEAPTKLTAFLILCHDYTWVHVGRFNEDLMSRCGNFSLFILENAEILNQDGTAFEEELTNHLLAVYVAMSASPAFGEPHIHGIGTNRIIVINEPGLYSSDDAIAIPGSSPHLYISFNSDVDTYMQAQPLSQNHCSA